MLPFEMPLGYILSTEWRQDLHEGTNGFPDAALNSYIVVLKL